MNTLPRFVVMTASANMPGSCNYPYGRVAVVELEPGLTEYPKMISDRAIGVRRIIALEDRRSIGRTRYSAYGRSLARCQDLAEDLNGEWGRKAQRAAAERHGVRV